MRGDCSVCRGGGRGEKKREGGGGERRGREERYEHKTRAQIS